MTKIIRGLAEMGVSRNKFILTQAQCKEFEQAMACARRRMIINQCRAIESAKKVMVRSR